MKKSLAVFALLSLGLVSRLAAVDAPPTEVVMIDHTKVDDAFSKNLPLLINSSYKVLAARRAGVPGQVEIHDHDTDVIFVTEGTATFVTGGVTKDPKPTDPGETRGTSITGGTVHHLTKGDVIIVPAGVPHWFTEVPGTFLYFVVKVTQK